MSDHITSLIRTSIPIIAGVVMVTIFDILSNFDRTIAAAVLSVLYYEVVRIAEDRGVRWAGYLLGVPRPPVYRLDTDALVRLMK